MNASTTIDISTAVNTTGTIDTGITTVDTTTNNSSTNDSTSDSAHHATLVTTVDCVRSRARGRRRRHVHGLWCWNWHWSWDWHLPGLWDRDRTADLHSDWVGYGRW